MQWLLKKFVKNADDTSNSEVRGAVGTFASIVCIICNVVLCGAKALIGALAGSVSIVADAMNNLSDAASNIISFFGFRLAGKPADAGHPYGHGRFEYLSGLLVAVLIIVVGIELLKASIEKLINPSPVEFSWALVIVLVLAIAVKLWMTYFNGKLGKMIDSSTLEATSADSRNDVISTGAVLLGALISKFCGVELDGWIGIAVALFILWSGVGLVKDTLDPLLGSAPTPETVGMIEKKALSYEGILGIHDLMVHDYGPGRQFASFHAEVPAETDVLISHDIIDNLEADFRENDGLEVVIHLDPVVTKDPSVAETKAWVAALVKETLGQRASIHDFRMVKGTTHTNLIFDCVLPYDAPFTPDEAKAAIRAAVAAKRPDHLCVILVDRDFSGAPTKD